MAHFHIDCNTKCSFGVNCVAEKFALIIIIQHVFDENVPDDHLLAIFKFAIFRQFFQNAVELFYRFTLFLLSWEEHIPIKCDISWADKSYLYHLPKFEGSQAINIVMRDFFLLVSVFPLYRYWATKETHIFDRKVAMVVPRRVLPLLISYDILSPIATSIGCFVSDRISPCHLLHLQLAFRIGLSWQSYHRWFGWSSVSSVIFSCARIASFTWIRHFSHLIGGSDVGGSQNGFIDNGVFLDSRADCAMSYRFAICNLSWFVVPIYSIYYSKLTS